MINIQIGLYFSPFAFLALTLTSVGDRRGALVSLAFASCAGTVVVFILLLNFITTGLFLDQGLTRSWPFANVEKLYELGTLPMVLDANLENQRTYCDPAVVA